MRRRTPLQPQRVLVLSFLLLILTGTLLLQTPWATPPDQPIPFIDALFTATSATCVTGLTVRDTGTGFTLFGQLVILSLIQLGGLGIMTFSILGTAVVERRLSIPARSLLAQTITGTDRPDLIAVLKLVLRFTLIVELLGAVLLWIRWREQYPVTDAAYLALFHAISAFCNAGFGLWTDSLAAYRADAYVVVVVCVLIVLGGLGFITVHDLLRLRQRKSLHARIVVWTTGVLTLGGAAVFWLLERRHLLQGLSASESLLVSLFQSVTARTAGFSTVDIGALASPTLLLLIVLMFIGGSPGSCAGGIKTTTSAILVLAFWNRLRRRTHVNVAGRTIPQDSVATAVNITLAGLGAVLLGWFALLVCESGNSLPAQHDPFTSCLFETVSALGTVGLSTGITPYLEPLSRLVLTGLMFSGRVGPLTLALALASPDPIRDWQYPEEEVMVG